MPLPIPAKWKQYFYKWVMILGSRSKLIKSDMKEAKVTLAAIEVKDIDGNFISMSKFVGKKLLIVNVASECGYTPQYADLQRLQEQFADKLIVLGFPSNDFGGQEPGSEEKIKFFCTENYQITFPLFAKVTVIGEGKHALYKWLTDPDQNGWNSQSPQWNFCKYMIDENGNLMHYFSQHVNPFDDEIVSNLNE